MLHSFAGLHPSQLAWHDPQNSYTRPNSITEHLTVHLSTRLKYFTTQEENIFQKISCISNNVNNVIFDVHE